MRSRGGECHAWQFAVRAEVSAYLKAAGHAKDQDGALLLSLGGPRNAEGTRALKAGGFYCEAVKHYMALSGNEGENLGPNALRATAVTNALENGADLSATMRLAGSCKHLHDQEL